jgi:hypothetical protein
MASFGSCLIHFDGKKAHLQVLVWFCINIFLHCRRIWLTLDGEERNVAQRCLQFVSDSMEVARSKISMQISLFIYHRGCYSAFTNSSMMDKEGVPSSSGIDIIDGETESDEYCLRVRQLNHGIPTCCHAFV